MTMSPFRGPTCHDIRAHLDSFISGELLVETTESVQTHLDACAGCRAERDRRIDLRARLRAELIGPDPDVATLERRILAGLTPERPAWMGPALPLAAAAVLVLAVVAWRALPGLTNAGADPAGGPGLASETATVPAIRPGPSDLPAEAPARTVDLAFYTDTALSHTYCALKRPMPDPPPSRALAANQLEGYAGLLDALASDLNGYTLADAHVCPNGDRRYAHLILQKGGELSSVFVTAKQAGDLPKGDATITGLGAVVHVRREGDLSISAVESDAHAGFIVQGVESPDTNFPTAPLARDVAGYLTQIAGAAKPAGRD